jgi:hypothetical protein
MRQAENRTMLPVTLSEYRKLRGGARIAHLRIRTRSVFRHRALPVYGLELAIERLAPLDLKGH